MDSLDSAILRTLLYAQVFQFPLTSDELTCYLIEYAASHEEIEYALNSSPHLQEMLCVEEGYITLADHPELIEMRREREQIAERLVPMALRHGAWLASIPFVRMIALTGALAARNPANERDDFDYLLVTKPGRVWLARAFAVICVRLSRLWGVELCPNYVLSEDQLAQQRHDLFMAREIAQMLPIYGLETYQQMCAENDWALEYLPNINLRRNFDHLARLSLPSRLVKQFLEAVLSTKIGDLLENWEYRRKYRRFAPKINHPESSAHIDADHVKGHFQDHGQRILAKYEELLRQYGLHHEAEVEHQEG